MCGICGVVVTGVAKQLEGAIQAMNLAGQHRGPDDQGSVTLNFESDGTNGCSLALGHTRLSIIDLSTAGHQPMADPEGRFWIVFNGEIYNYLELREELQTKGYSFRSRTDTEVILAAWREWGVESFKRFNGMWAFAIVDTQEKEVVLVRDRFGVKPLHYIFRPGFFAFASEIKQLMAGFPEKPRLNLETAADFFFWGYQSHTDESFVAGIRSLPGGHFIRCKIADLLTGKFEFRKFWQPEAEISCLGLTPSERFLELFFDAVKLRLRSDVPVGVTLSGGLDSSSIACVASRLQKAAGVQNPLRSFTVDFVDQGFSEADYAQAVVDAAGLNALHVQPNSEQLMSDWEEFVRCMDEPFAGLSYYSNWKLYQKIRQQSVPVILNGQGGDELLLGYERYRIPFLRFLWKARRLGKVAKEIIWTSRRCGLSLKHLVAYSAYFGFSQLRIRRRLRLLRPYVSGDFFQMGLRRTEVIVDACTHASLHDLLIKEFTRYQLPHLLQHEDSVSMHFAIESRNPFLDYRLFNFVLGLNIENIIHDGWSKYLLRESMAEILPEKIRMRTIKMGFNTPTERLFDDGRQYFEALLDRNTSDRLLNVPALRKSFERGILGGTLLCSAMSYLRWKEEFAIQV